MSEQLEPSEKVLNRFKESVKKEYNHILKYIEDEKDDVIFCLAESKYYKFLYHKKEIEDWKSKERMGFMDRLCARLFSKE